MNDDQIMTVDILSNAHDSLQEAMSCYKRGLDGDSRAYKYAVLHFAHYLELLLKHCVSMHHWMLIFKNPCSKCDSESMTISIWEAVQVLDNLGVNLNKEFLSELRWLKKLRNQIEHFDYEMDARKVRLTIGRLMRGLAEFQEHFPDEEFVGLLEHDVYDLFNSLKDEYTQLVHDAETAAHAEGETLTCFKCGLKCLNIRSGDGYCHYCNDITDQNVECLRCGTQDIESNMNSGFLGEDSWLCNYCYDWFNSDKS